MKQIKNDEHDQTKYGTGSQKISLCINGKLRKATRRLSRLPPVFRIRDIFIRIRILGSVHWITDPDPGPVPEPALNIPSMTFKVPTKKEFFSNFFFLLLTVCLYTVHQSSEIKSNNEVTKQLKSKFF
jgi:hypothetical protein